MKNEIKVGDKVLVNDATGNGSHSWYGEILWTERSGYRVRFDNGRDGWYRADEIVKV